MTYCSLLFQALDKRLEEKKSIDEIAKLCADIDNPRGKVLRIIKAHKGEKWLIENAGWLGYEVNYIRNPEGSKTMNENMSEKISIIESKDVVVLPKDIEMNFGLCINNNRLYPFLKKVDKDNGIAIFGRLEESDIRWWVQIEPSVEIDAFGFGAEIDLHYIKVTRFTRIYNKGDEDNTEDEDFKITIINTIYPVKTCCVGFYIDSFMHSDKLHDKIKKFALGLSDDFPKLPKFKKSQHPDWEWSYALTKRLTYKKWEENLELYGTFDMALIDWDISPYPVEEYNKKIDKFNL